jgi:hypothetical protein
MWRHLLVVLFSSALLFACGGGQPNADGPGDVDTDGAGEGEGEGPIDAKPKDNIVRDADGDGTPDDQEKAGCDGKNETEGKINMECAWGDDGKCVKAKGGM